MKNTNHLIALRVLLAAACGLGFASLALAQTDSPDNAQSLLESVKRRDLERQIAAKQTYLDRLAEDLAKGQKESAEMQANVESTAKLVRESASQIEKLQSNQKRLEQVLELTKLRIEAETLKAEGLKMLGDAQAKALGALSKHSEQTNLRASLGAAEMKELSPGTAETAPEHAGSTAAGKARPSSSLSELRKKLAASETSVETADKIAHDAMRAAAAKLELANIASGKAKRRAATVEGDIPPIAEKPLDLEEKAGDHPEKAATPK